MDRLPDCRVHRRGLADLDHAGGTGGTPASLRPTVAQCQLYPQKRTFVGALQCPLRANSGHRVSMCRAAWIRNHVPAPTPMLLLTANGAAFGTFEVNYDSFSAMIIRRPVPQNSFLNKNRAGQRSRLLG